MDHRPIRSVQYYHKENGCLSIPRIQISIVSLELKWNPIVVMDAHNIICPYIFIVCSVHY